MDALAESLDQVGLSREWTEEIGSRIEQVESGRVKPVPWEDVEARYRDMGFDRAFPNQTRVEDVIEALDKDFAQRPKAKP